jgi:hypothetical protein
LWDHAGLADAVGRTVLAAVADLPADPTGTIGILDETRSVKQGTKTPGVQRPSLGCVGKVENGTDTVHLAAARGTFKAMLASERFLPESGDADRPRRRDADIPDAVGDRAKWRIGRELAARARDQGWAFDGRTFDEGYGGKPGFRAGLDAAGQRYVGDVLLPTRTLSRPDECGGDLRVAGSAAAGGEGVSDAAANGPGYGLAGEGGGRASGEGPPSPAPPDRGPESPDGAEEVFHHQRPEAGRPASGASGGVHALEWEARVPDREGRNRTDPLRGPLRLAETAPGVVPVSPGLRGRASDAATGGNPEVTPEQVCRTSKSICRAYLRRRRGTTESECLLDILNYHQARNAQAKQSRRKRPRRLRRFAAR